MLSVSEWVQCGDMMDAGLHTHHKDRYENYHSERMSQHDKIECWNWDEMQSGGS